MRRRQSELARWKWQYLRDQPQLEERTRRFLGADGLSAALGRPEYGEGRRTAGRLFSFHTVALENKVDASSDRYISVAAIRALPFMLVSEARGRVQQDAPHRRALPRPRSRKIVVTCQRVRRRFTSSAFVVRPEMPDWLREGGRPASRTRWFPVLHTGWMYWSSLQTILPVHAS